MIVLVLIALYSSSGYTSCSGCNVSGGCTTFKCLIHISRVLHEESTDRKPKVLNL